MVLNLIAWNSTPYEGYFMSTGLKTGALTLVFISAAAGVSAPIAAESGFEKIGYRFPLGVIVISSNSLLQAKSPSPEKRELASRFLMYVTAYSSSVDETDSTPHVTASGTKTRDGVIASNTFPIGTRVKIPKLFGDKIFVVEDRMHNRFTDRIDVWMPSKWEALSFGKAKTEVNIVEL